MGHPMAPSVMQRLTIAMAHYLHHHHSINMVAYLDDWLFFGPPPPLAQHILASIQNLGLTVNTQKSILTLTTTPV
jgi:hypothetical protein